MRPSRRAPNAVLLAVAACLISAATAEELGELGEGSCVSSLDTGSFEAAIRGKNALVVFFAPWCGHCKALHPHFERLCTDLSDQEDFLAAVVDATEEVQLAESHGVTGMRRRVSQSTHARADTECCAATGRLSDHRLVRQARVLRPHRRSLQRRPLGGGNAGLCQLQDRLGRCSRGCGLNPKAGLVKTMDALVKEWVTHSRLPEHLIERARETVLVTARATSDSLTQEGEKIDAKTYIAIFEKALKDTGYIKVPTLRTHRARLASPQLIRLMCAAGRAGTTTTAPPPRPGTNEPGKRASAGTTAQRVAHVRPLRGAAPGQSEACARGDHAHHLHADAAFALLAGRPGRHTVLEMQEKGCAFKIEGFQLIYGAFHSHSAQARQAPRDGTRYNTIYFIFAKVNFKA